MHRSRRLTASLAALLLALPLAGCGDDGSADAGDDTTPTSSSAPVSKSPETSPKPSEPAGPTLAVTVAGSDVSPMAETIELSAGDSLVVTVQSDRAGELHVHSSPEQYVEFGPGKTRKKLTFDQPGQVDIEEHESEALVARLLVQ